MNDFKFAFRAIRARLWLSATIVLTLALGIGANTTVFSWIEATLLNPVPGVPASRDLFSVAKGESGEFSYPDYLDLVRDQEDSSRLTAFALRPVYMMTQTTPERILCTVATHNYFDVLDTQPLLGKGFTAQDDTDGGQPSVVISNRLWTSRFSKQPDIVGQTIRINSAPFTISGVMPPLFQGTQTGIPSDLWIPIGQEQKVVSGGDRLTRRGDTWLMLLGRSAPGKSLPLVTARLEQSMSTIVQQFPTTHLGRTDIQSFPLWKSPNGANGLLVPLLSLMMLAAGTVLLLACVNVATLVLVNVSSRDHGFAIRLALGGNAATNGRLILIECLMLAVAGGLAALLITGWSSQLFLSMLPHTGVPLLFAIAVDQKVFLFALLASTVATMAVGLIPAIRSARVNPAVLLNEASLNSSLGRRRSFVADLMVGAQVALSTFLLIMAALLVRSFENAEQVSPGFNPDHTLLVSTDLFPAGYTAADGLVAEKLLLSKIAALPGVRSATLSNWAPLGFKDDEVPVAPQGYVRQPRESMDVEHAIVGPDYLATMEIPLVSGRDFTLADQESAPRVAIVNRAFVRRFWGDGDAVGRRIRVEDADVTVVGVAEDTITTKLNARHDPFLYLPLFQHYYHGLIATVRTGPDPLSAANAIESAIHELNQNLPVFEVQTLRQRLSAANAGRRMAALLAGCFGLLALVLATVGMYAVASYRTEMSTKEFGIRVALGAQRRDLFLHVLQRGARLVLTGALSGVVCALIGGNLLRRFLFGVSPFDIVTFTGIVALLIAVGFAALAVPARRASRIPPTVALRFQ